MAGGGNDDKQDRGPRDEGDAKRKPQQQREKLHREDFERVSRIEDEEGFDGEPPPRGGGASNTAQAATAEAMRGLRDPGVGGQETSAEGEKKLGELGVVPAPPEPKAWTFGGGGDDEPPKMGSAVIVEMEEAELPVQRGTWSALAAAPPEPPEPDQR